MSRSKNSLDYATYNLVASQNPRADIRLLPDHDAAFTYSQQHPRPTAAAGAGSVAGGGETKERLAPYPVRQDDHNKDYGFRYAMPLSCERTNVPPPFETGLLTSIPQNEQRTATGQETDIRCDVELARIALGLKQSPLFRLWIILQQMNRDTGLQGHTRAAFDAALRTYGVKGCDAYTSRLLRRGHGLYWQLHDGVIYPIGYISLCKRLITRAATFGLHNLYATNAPGQMRDMFISVSGAQADFEGAVLNAWYAAKNNPTIARLTLSALFNRSAYTLRQLETRAGIQITYNEVETTDPVNVPLNADGDVRHDVYKTRDAYGRLVFHFHLANTYTSTRCKQHYARGQGRKASVLFKRLIESDELPGMSAAGSNRPGKLNPSRRIYCETENRAERSRRQGNDNVLLIPDRPGQGRAMVWGVYRH